MNITTNLIKLSSYRGEIVARAVYNSRYFHGPEATAEKLGPILSMLPGSCFDPSTDRRYYTYAEILDIDAYPSGIIYGDRYLIAQVGPYTDVFYIVSDSAKKSN